MLSDIKYKTKELAKLILSIHTIIKKWLHDSAVSLRDIERLRQLYNWFIKNLKLLKSTSVSSLLGAYNNNNEERAILMSLYFTYLLRFNFSRREEI
jgi:hypothetical protein